MTAENGVTWLVNSKTSKHTGPFTTRFDALLALNIAEDMGAWHAMTETEFDAYLGGP
ncbi:hypothetical protein [Nocardia sp. NPDC055049]